MKSLAFILTLVFAMPGIAHAIGNRQAAGHFEVNPETGVANGWAIDPDVTTASVTVTCKLVQSANQQTCTPGSASTAGNCASLGSTTANLPFDLSGAYWIQNATQGNHGFTFRTPAQYFDGRVHFMSCYATDVNTSSQVILGHGQNGFRVGGQPDPNAPSPTPPEPQCDDNGNCTVPPPPGPLDAAWIPESTGERRTREANTEADWVRDNFRIVVGRAPTQEEINRYSQFIVDNWEIRFVSFEDSHRYLTEIEFPNIRGRDDTALTPAERQQRNETCLDDIITRILGRTPPTSEPRRAQWLNDLNLGNTSCAEILQSLEYESDRDQAAAQRRADNLLFVHQTIRQFFPSDLPDSDPFVQALVSILNNLGPNPSNTAINNAKNDIVNRARNEAAERRARTQDYYFGGGQPAGVTCFIEVGNVTRTFRDLTQSQQYAAAQFREFGSLSYGTCQGHYNDVVVAYCPTHIGQQYSYQINGVDPSFPPSFWRNSSGQGRCQ